MKIQYVADDGEIFATEKECLEHEASRGTVLMWDDDGTTDRVSNALLVYLGDGEVDAPGGNQFYNMCQKALSNSNGIDYDADDPVYGWWYWDSYDEQYRYLDDEVREAITQAIMWHGPEWKR